MKMSDLTREQYQYKLRTVECIDILKEQSEKRLKDAEMHCEECLYGACTDSLKAECIENQCLSQLTSVYNELVSLCIKNNLLDENSRVFK